MFSKFSDQLWTLQQVYQKEVSGRKMGPPAALVNHSSTLAWKLPWMEEPGGLQSTGLLRVPHESERLHFHFSVSCIGQGNGNPLQCSCLENPRDGEPGGLAVYGVTQSWTRLKLLSSSSSSSSSSFFPLVLEYSQWWKLHCFPSSSSDL